MFWLIACAQTEAPAPAPEAPAPAPAPAPPPPAWSVDLHVDTLTELADRSVGFDDPGLQSGIPAMVQGGTNVVVNVLWPPREGEHEPYTFSQLDRFEKELAAVSSKMALARSPAEADEIVASGRIATLLALEGAHGIETSGVEALQKLHARGLTMLGLTWSLSNRFAGSSGDKGAGLTEEGRALVAEAERLGVLLDLSHASRQTTLEVCAVAKSPLVASHSNARSSHDVPRNLSEEELVCIAKSGGLVGVMFHGPFVAEGAVGIEQVADQVDALVRAAGVEHVGLGSDYDGDIQTAAGLEGAGKLPALWAELRERGYTEEQLAQMRGGNFRRVWSAVRP
jgi:membrane dipeptidase